jgi:hypothetical protein
VIRAPVSTGIPWRLRNLASCSRRASNRLLALRIELVVDQREQLRVFVRHGFLLTFYSYLANLERAVARRLIMVPLGILRRLAASA